MPLPTLLKGLATFLLELRAFPNGEYDDQVDSLTQMLDWSFWHWRRLHEQRNANGRLIEPIRGSRPPLPPLPEWIQ